MLIGAPCQDNGKNYNSVFVIADGEILHRYDKQYLPNYGVFDEKRYFSSGDKPLVLDIQNTKVGIIICEVMWYKEPTYLSKNADIICVINASPFEINKHQQRLSTAKQRVSEINVPLVYINQFGGQDELIFDGASFALNSDGLIAMQLPAYQEKLAYLEFNNHKLTSSEVASYPNEIASIYEADIDHWITICGHLLEPLIIAILGVLIGGLVIAMYLPIFKLGTVI